MNLCTLNYTLENNSKFHTKYLVYYINLFTFATTEYNTTEHNTTQQNTTQYNTTQHNTTQYNTIQYKKTQYNKHIKQKTSQTNTN